MPGIFINYRRDDAPGVAGRLYDHLARSFSRGRLFIDVDAIKPGLDFVKQLDAQVSQCDVLLAVIGPHWINAADDKGRRRLDGDHDYVRIEIASALKRDIPVIPVLVDGASVPTEAELPEDLKPLARRHALELRHTRFAADADAVVSALNAAMPRQKKTWFLPLLATAAACVVIGAAVWWFASTRFTANEIAAPSAQTSAPVRTEPPGQSAGQPLTVDEARRKADEMRQKLTALRQETTPQAKPATAPTNKLAVMPGIPGVSVALGDSFDTVKQALPAAAERRPAISLCRSTGSSSSSPRTGC
jgi:hypothetical protein